MYLKKPRNTAISNGFDEHTPKDSDQASELVAIYVDLELAKQCRQLVHGHSGFMKALNEDLRNEGGKEGVDMFYYTINTGVSKAAAQAYSNMRDGKNKRVEDFFRDIELVYERKYNLTSSMKA